MKKATKGALAIAAAGSLLVGGAGSLAYWTGTATVGGASISSGTISLSAPDCANNVPAGTHGWQFDGGSAFTPGTDTIVPGDTLTKVCNSTLTMTGNHIGATLALGSASFAGPGGDANLEAALNGASATFKVDGAAYAPITSPGTHTVQVTVTVPFPSSVTADNTKSVSALLDDLTVTATQTHDAS
jgi:alternate signal-mediated exported protein